MGCIYIVMMQQFQVEIAKWGWFWKNDMGLVHALHSIPEVDQYNTFGLPKDADETTQRMQPLLKALQEDPLER